MPTADETDVRAAFLAHRNAIEDAYDLMLAYAAQGVAGEGGSGAAGQIRQVLEQCEAALDGVSRAVADCIERRGLGAAAPYRAFIDILTRDSQHARAMVQLVLAQPSIGSALVDNLNASSHLRALLTDLFLANEVLKA